MKRTLVNAIIAFGLGVVATPTFASAYVVNGHAASAAETRLLASYGVQPGNWKVDGYGISPAVQNVAAPSDTKGRNCRYVLDVLLCD
jgi:hypothetical protein